MSEITLMIKLRDAHQLIADAYQEWLEAQGPKEEGSSWSPNKSKWTKEEGSRGPYEKSEDVNSPDHKAMVKDLANHDGKLTREGLFYWLFENGTTVGRKPARR